MKKKAIMHALKGFSIRSPFEAIPLQMMYQEQYLIHFSKNLQYILFAMVHTTSIYKKGKGSDLESQPRRELL